MTVYAVLVGAVLFAALIEAHTANGLFRPAGAP
jgi:hypothetical protein